MKKLFSFLVVCATICTLPAMADYYNFQAQGGGGGGAVSSVSALDSTVTVSPTTGAVKISLPTVNSNVGTFTLATVTADAQGRITAVSSGTGGGSPGGTTGQVQYNNSGSFGGFTASGDATINTGTGAIAVSKTGGVAFAPSATTDTTNATNISSGTLSPARMAVFTSGANGLVPASGGSTGTKYLSDTGAFTTPAGSGSSGGITPTTTDLRVPWGERLNSPGQTIFTAYGAYAATNTGTASNADSTDGLWINYLSGTTTFTGPSYPAANCRYDSHPRIWIRVKPVDTTALRFFVGLNWYAGVDPSSADTVAETTGFRFNPATDTNGHIRFYTSNSAGTANVIDTGISYTASTEHTFCVDDSDLTSIKGYIDGSLVATSTTDLPTSTKNVTWTIGVIPTGGVAKNVQIGAIYGDND